jgi:hypothetical protein
MLALLGSWMITSFCCPVIFFFGNSENKLQRLEACVIMPNMQNMQTMQNIHNMSINIP